MSNYIVHTRIAHKLLSAIGLMLLSGAAWQVQAAVDCDAVAVYNGGDVYTVGGTVQHDGVQYQCKVDSWCSAGDAHSLSYYEPGAGLAWEEAWEWLGVCGMGSSSSSSSSSSGSSSGGGSSSGAGTSVTAEQFSSQPFLSTPSSDPLVMLAMSVDHELFKKAYNDYSDLDGGDLDEGDTTYRNDFDYYGYFDSDLCYTYSIAQGRFNPTSVAADAHICAASSSSSDAYALADGWSGNFLNWASMSRIDIIRAVLYGGKRDTDNTSRTVLQRAYLPDDTHAFAKVYSGTDLGDFTPYTYQASTLDALSLCNVTLDATSVPLIRVGVGSHRYWSITNGSSQCNGLSAPAAIANLVARVEVCDDVIDGPRKGNCREYPNNQYKPAGLLQSYGEDGSIRFGLLTGSYGKNLQGGVLRKDINKFANNSDASLDEVDLDSGIFLQSTAGIVSNINSFRLSSWSGSGHSDCNTYSITIDEVKGQTSGRQCSNWGNPISEIYAEALRYFTGASAATADFIPDSGREPDGVDVLSTWQDPLESDEWCANCSIILLSTGPNSFDGDDLDSTMGDLPSLTSATLSSTFTDVIGNLEQGGSFSGQYFVGGVKGDIAQQDGSCTAKTPGLLSNVEGICAERPALEGTYSVAGLAYYAKTQDIRDDIDGLQTVSTYAVDLAEAIPSFNIPVFTGIATGVKSISFLPSCQSKRGTADWSNCSIFDVTPEFIEYDGGFPVAASYLFHWEDSYWGSDYDLDMSTRIRFCVGTACNGDTRFDCPLNSDNTTKRDPDCSNDTVNSGEVKIINTVALVSAGNELRFGYTIAGVVNDGRAQNGQIPWNDRPGGVNYGNFVSIDDEDSLNSTIKASGIVYTASVDANNSVKLLEKPLYYAAKYGNFEDYDGSNSPSYGGSASDPTEWDREDADGNSGSDGVPDNYFQVSNPARLEKSLGQVFSNIKNRVSSGASASIITSSSNGDGMIFNAIYYPAVEADGERVNWAGHLFSFFKDEYGNLREDMGGNGGSGNAILEDCSIDPIVNIFYDTASSPPETKLRRYAATAGNCNPENWSDASGSTTPTPSSTLHKLEDFHSVWDARNQLSEAVDITEQRSYSSSASKRHILTSVTAASSLDLISFTVDELGMGTLGAGLSGANADNYRYLNVEEDDVNNVINFIRGDETIDGYRNRSVNFDGVSGAEPWLLGDIVNSTPVSVSAPIEHYDSLYGDTTYSAFKSHYQNRRQVVYVGANDGMLHAFNSGFWDEANSTVQTSLTTETAYPLGTELWAYVPMNLLPHLQWLAQPNYGHSYYIDGEPRSYDVQIFDSGIDSNGINHVNGWGTILVVGMRFGGGEISIDSDGDNTADTPLRSAYIILDITDPEQPPALLGEFTRDNLGLTTSVPSLVKNRQPSASGDWSAPLVNEWKLVFGSGPDLDSLADIHSSQNARMFEIDLVELVDDPESVLTAPIAPQTAGTDLGVGNAFVGDFLTADWNSDLIDDAVYFGLVSGTASAPSGQMMRYHQSGTHQGGIDTLINPGQPFVSAPLPMIDDDDRRWLFFGSGRLFSRGDLNSVAQQTFYGIKELGLSYEDLSDNTYSNVSLVNTTAIRVNGVNDIDNATIDGTTITTFNDLETAIENKPGWRLNLDHDGTNPSARNLYQATQFVATILFPVYTPPSGGSCEIGSSDVYQLYSKTGTAPALSAAYASSQSDDGKVFSNDGVTSKIAPLNSGDAIGTLDNRTHYKGRVTGKTSTGEFIEQTIIGVGFGVPSGLDGRNSWRQIFNWEES